MKGLLLVSTVMVLAGCTSLPAAQAEPAARPTWADDFVQDYEAKHGLVDDLLSGYLLAGANASCGDLVAGRTLPQVWQSNVDRGMSSDQSATVIDLAIKYYCPEEG